MSNFPKRYSHDDFLLSNQKKFLVQSRKANDFVACLQNGLHSAH